MRGDPYKTVDGSYVLCVQILKDQMNLEDINSIRDILTTVLYYIEQTIQRNIPQGIKWRNK